MITVKFNLSRSNRKANLNFIWPIKKA